MEDRAKKRREYIWKTTTAYLSIGVGVVILLLSPLLILLILPELLFNGYAIPDYIRDRWDHAQSLLYVPPVREQIAALPAGEVLLRGSDQPVASPGELLRAAHDRAEPESGDLLRPNEIGAV